MKRFYPLSLLLILILSLQPVSAHAEAMSEASATDIDAFSADGWVEQDGNLYYYEEGELQTGWFQVGADRYFADDNGVVARDESLTIGGILYLFDEDGRNVGYLDLNGTENNNSDRTETQVPASPSDPVPFRHGVGDNLFFGVYEQDGNTENGPESIEWIILAREENRALLLSKYCLDPVVYSYEYGVEWRDSFIRPWLNGMFYDTAFSRQEKNCILETTVMNAPNPDYDTPGGEDTEDHIFCLSVSEFRSYVPNEAARGIPTAQAEKQGAEVRGGYTPWWLRGMGEIDRFAAFVWLADNSTDLELWTSGTEMDNKGISIRPALWVDLSLAERSSGAEEEAGASAIDADLGGGPVRSAEPVKVYIDMRHSGSPYVDMLRYEPVRVSYAEATSEWFNGDNPSDSGSAAYAVDGDLASAWQEGVEGSGEGESITLYFEESAPVSLVVICPGNTISEALFDDNNRPTSMGLSFSDGTEYILRLPSYSWDEETKKAVFIPDRTIAADSLTVTILAAEPGNAYDETVISEIEVFRTQTTMEAETSDAEQNPSARSGDGQTDDLSPDGPAWVRIGDDSYFFDEDGSMITGWLEWPEGSRSWYFLDAEGRLQLGWFEESGNTYYADPEKDGAILINTTKYIEDNYYSFDNEGRLLG